MNTSRAPYRVHQEAVRIPIARREVSRVSLSRGHVTLEFTSLDDPLTSTVDLYALESIDLGSRAATPHPVIGVQAPTLAGLVGRRVTSCAGTRDGDLDLRMTGSARVRSSEWTVGFGDGRHWSPHVGGGIAEWRPGERRQTSGRARRAPKWDEEPLEAPRQLPLVGQTLQAISFSDGHLSLVFGVEREARPDRSIERLPDVEVEINGAFALGPDRQVIDAEEPRSVAPLLTLVGVATTGATVSPDGTLGIRFADGANLTAGPGERNDWTVTLADLGGWYLGRDGSVRSSKPKETRPLSEAGHAQFVRAYLEYSATDRPDLFWVTDRLRDLIEHAPDDAYEVIRELVREAPSPYVLSIVAAGPLEDLLSDWGERIIDRLEADARDDPKLMAACAGVWQLFMPDEVWARLRNLVTSQAQS